MKKKTGYKLDKFVRPPEGNYSELALKTMQDMGYTTVLWSLAWYDYNPSDQPSTDYVVGRFRNDSSAARYLQSRHKCTSKDY